MTVSRRQLDGTVVVAVAGDVDHTTASRLLTEITAALDETAGGACVVDLTVVTFLGSDGLDTLLDAAREAEERRSPLRIVVNANRPVIRPIELTGLDTVLSLYHSVDEALDVDEAALGDTSSN
jgi:anti-sigma B factor antagonist